MCAWGEVAADEAGEVVDAVGEGLDGEVGVVVGDGGGLATDPVAAGLHVKG